MFYRSSLPNSFLLSLICLLPLKAQLSAYTIPQTGDSKAAVTAALGQPIGSIELRDKEWLLYPQGEVTIKDGIVTAVDIMSPTEFAADQARLAAEQAEWERNQVKMEAARRVEGLAIKKEKLASVRFNSLPPEDQANYWRNFQNTYPSVDVTEELADAMERHQQAVAALREQRAIQALEERLTAAEREAREAKQEAQRLQRQVEANNRSYGLRYYRDGPYYRHRDYYYRPPTITIHTDGENKSIQVHKEGHWQHQVIQSETNGSNENQRPPHWRDSVWKYKN